MTRLKVFGIPEPQARPRWGNGRVFSPKTAWWKACNMQARITRPPTPYDGAVRLTIDFYMPRPRRAPAARRWHRCRPDVDNLAKAVMDALTDAGWWKDDGCVAELFVSKSYSTDQVIGVGAVIVVEPLE